MTDRDPANPPTPAQDGFPRETDSRTSANQEAARRPGVDADNALDDRGHMTSTPHEGSAYQPLRAGSDEDRQRSDRSDYVIDQGATAANGESHGVSRAGLPTQHGDAIRESQSAPGGGSVFQPLQEDPRHLENFDDKQRGNPVGQNQQGLGERVDGRSQDDKPRGYAPDPRTPRP